MILLTFFAFLAGILTVFSPCVFPVLPIVLSGSVGNGKWRPLGIIAGFLASFVTATLFLTFAVRSFGLDPSALRTGAAVIFIVMALILLLPALKNRFMEMVSSIINRTHASQPNSVRPGFFPGFVTGLGLGIVWTPCVGPIMASVITLAVSQSVDAGAFSITLAYALGTSVPLFAVMQGGRALVRRLSFLTSKLDTIQRVFGALVLLTGIALLTGMDRNFQSWMLNAFPKYGSGLTAIEDNGLVRSALANRTAVTSGTALSSTTTAQPDIPDRTGSDPLSRTSGEWFNSSSLTLEGLKGSVVLVDFWTYSCINCLRTMPYLKQWQEKYASSGLVIVGVHSPEFAFERDGANVRAAIASIGIKWPVVQDNDYGIWHAFSNQYWPAHYLFDRNGSLVSSHFGEGAYAETEKQIRDLLGLKESASLPESKDLTGETDSALGDIRQADVAQSDAAQSVTTEQGASPVQSANPETYLGSLRGKPASFGADIYTMQKPGKFEWSLGGKWTIEDEYIESTGPASLMLDFNAREVFLVISRVDGTKAEMTVMVDGEKVTTADVKDGKLTVGENRLYQVFGSQRMRKGVMTIRVTKPVRLYAFTFSQAR